MPEATRNISTQEEAAGSLLPALDLVAESGIASARDAGRYAMRLRFAMNRVRDLRASSLRLGGVFEQARLEVALSILDTHAGRAAAFVERMARRSAADQRPYYTPRPAPMFHTAATEDPAADERDRQAA